jgi:acyl carrier protein
MMIENQIKDYIAKNLLFSDNGFPYPDEASFLNEGIVDSVGVMELVAFVEDKFGLKVDDLDVTPDNFDSVSRLASYIRSKSGK